MTDTRRKLTTVFSADVQGYSRLMGADEEGTLATLKSYREAMGRLIASHGGRVVNTWGDALIAEFPSVVEAVRAAVDVQNELATRNQNRPTETRMQFRIGINLGDVIADGDDIYGDGVNVAARLQASAEPGGIIISRTVHDQVRNKLSVGFDFLGDLEVKNIEDAVPSYAVRVGGERPRLQPTPRGAARDDVASREGADGLNRRTAVFAVAGFVLIAVNVLTWDGIFWAKWPLLGIAVAIGLGWAGRQRKVNARALSFAIGGLALVLINLFSWDGTFWAVWPLLAVGVAVVLALVMRRRT